MIATDLVINPHLGLEVKLGSSTSNRETEKISVFIPKSMRRA